MHMHELRHPLRLDYTDQGIRNIKDSPKRADAFAEAAQAAGVKIKELYWTLGTHDGVLVLEAEEGGSVASLMLSLASAGNVRTETLRAFSRPEMEQVLSTVR